MDAKNLKFEKELLELKKEVLLFEHNLKMERLKFERENNRLFHEMALERERIKSAEIKKSQLRKQDLNYMRSYANEN